MLLHHLKEVGPELQRLAADSGARHLRVFGSVARGEETPCSDVDLLAELPRGYDIFAQRLPWAQRLSEFLNRPVDLVPENELSPHLRESVLAEAVEL